MRAAAQRHIGSGLALVSAIAFALNVACIPLVYQAGGNIHAINFIRPVFFLVCVGLVLLARRASFRLPSMQLSGAVILGGLLCFEFYVVFSAVKYIPVGLTVLIMYTYPLIVAVLNGLVKHGRVPIRLVLVLLVSFFGLVLALSAPVDAVDWRGVVLALCAALGMCAIVTISERSMQGYDNAVIMFYTMISASTVMLAMYLAGIPMVWPGTVTGWAALSAATTCYVIATFMLFVSISMIGPVRFAAIDNTVPVWATLLGFILLGEQLVPTQWLGMLLVVGGVIAVQFLHEPQSDRARHTA